MVAIDTAIAFLHPLAVIILACVWSLWILRNEYQPYLPEEEVADEEAVAAEEAEGV